MRKALLIPVVWIAFACSVSGAARAQGVAANDTTSTMQEWAPLAWMIGDWDGTSTSPGVGNGTFSVRPDLGGSVLVRKNSAPMVNGGTHEDLMVLYHLRSGAFRAIYFDNERHVIEYTVTPTTSPSGAVFLSDETKGMPQFRLTYTMTDAKTAKIAFELKPPGATDFKPYLEGSATRK